MHSASTLGSKILRDSSFRVFANIVQLFTSLALGVFAVRLLGATGKGQLYLVIQTATLGSRLMGMGLGPSYQYHYTKNLLNRSSILWHVIITILISITLILIIYVWGEPLLHWILGAALSQALILIACLAVPLNLALLFFASLLYAQDQGIKIGSMYSVLGSLVNLLMLFILVSGLHLHTMGAALAYLLGMLIQFVPIAILVWRKTLPWPPPKLLPLILNYSETTPPLLKYGTQFLISGIMVSSVFRIDVFLVNSMAGTFQLGLYSIAVAFAELVLLIPNALGSVLFARLPGLAATEQTQIMLKSVRTTVTLAILVGILVGAFAHLAIEHLIGIKYISALVPLWLLIPGLVFMSVNYVFANFFAAQGTPMLTAFAFSVGLVLDILIDLFIIPRAGIAGAAIASSVSYFAVSMILARIIRKRTGTRWADLFLLKSQDIKTMRTAIASVLRRSSKSIG